MKINRTFWVREKGSIKQAFSYAKDSTASNFAKKYGGSLQSSYTLEEEAAELVAEGDVFSVLVNSEPELEMDVCYDSEYVVYVKAPREAWSKWKSFPTISEANTEAKNIIKKNESVLVIKVS